MIFIVYILTNFLFDIMNVITDIQLLQEFSNSQLNYLLYIYYIFFIL